MNDSHSQPRPGADDIRIDTARDDLQAAEEADLGRATHPQLVLLVERLRGSLEALLRICDETCPTRSRRDH